MLNISPQPRRSLRIRGEPPAANMDADQPAAQPAAQPARVTITTKLSDTPVLDTDKQSLPAWKWQFRNFVTRLDLQDLFLTESGIPTEGLNDAAKKKFADANSILTYAATNKLHSIMHIPRLYDLPNIKARSPGGFFSRYNLGSPFHPGPRHLNLQDWIQVYRRVLGHTAQENRRQGPDCRRPRRRAPVQRKEENHDVPEWPGSRLHRVGVYNACQPEPEP
jgi:hypothetical protein